MELVNLKQKIFEFACSRADLSVNYLILSWDIIIKLKYKFYFFKFNAEAVRKTSEYLNNLSILHEILKSFTDVENSNEINS